jgi:hypothetical protein
MAHYGRGNDRAGPFDFWRLNLHYSRTASTGSTRKRVPARLTEANVHNPGEVLQWPSGLYAR